MQKRALTLRRLEVAEAATLKREECLHEEMQALQERRERLDTEERDCVPVTLKKDVVGASEGVFCSKILIDLKGNELRPCEEKTLKLADEKKVLLTKQVFETTKARWSDLDSSTTEEDLGWPSLKSPPSPMKAAQWMKDRRARRRSVAVAGQDEWAFCAVFLF